MTASGRPFRIMTLGSYNNLISGYHKVYVQRKPLWQGISPCCPYFVLVFECVYLYALNY